MKLRLAALAFLPALLAAAPTPPPAPDLVVISVTSPNLDRGIVRVRVRNQGNAASVACIISVQLTGLQQGTTSVTLDPIPAGTTVPKDILGAASLSQLHYTVIVDRSNLVHESNERNNTLSGQFGGKP
jgi:subtilase family serine protease